jgi:hypothetical protein
MKKRDRLEPLADGWVAFTSESGERWKHKDVTENPTTGATVQYRLFVNDGGEQRRYTFAPSDPRDSTVWDLREQLRRSQPAAAGAGTS